MYREGYITDAEQKDSADQDTLASNALRKELLFESSSERVWIPEQSEVINAGELTEMAYAVDCRVGIDRDLSHDIVVKDFVHVILVVSPENIACCAAIRGLRQGEYMGSGFSKCHVLLATMFSK